MSCPRDHHRRSTPVTGRDRRTHAKTNNVAMNDARKSSVSVSNRIHHRSSRDRRSPSSSRGRRNTSSSRGRRSVSSSRSGRSATSSKHRSATPPRSHSHHTKHSSRQRRSHRHRRHSHRGHRHRGSTDQIRHKSHDRKHHKQNNDTAFVESSLRLHNRLRRRHGAQPLQLNDELSRLAQEWANHLASTNQFKHSGTTYQGTTAGENLYYQSWPITSGKESTKAWYDEIEDYDFNSGEFSHATGHFTQLVWKESKEVGFAKAKNGSMHYVVAMYFPPGNVIGQFKQNVLPPSK